MSAADNIMDQNIWGMYYDDIIVIMCTYMYTCIIVFMLHYLQYDIFCSSYDILPGDLSG